MTEDKKNIDDLIGSLSEDLKPVKAPKPPLVYTLPWLLVSIALCAFIVTYVGIRHDFHDRLHDATFLFEVIIISLIAIFSALTSSCLMVPDMRGKKWLVPVSFTLGAVFLLWNVVKAFAEGMHMPHLHFDHCMKEGLFIAFIPMMALIFFMRSGTTTRPKTMGLMNLMAGSSIAYVGLRLTCAMDTVGHATILHLTPYVIIGSLIGLFARRLYKW